jgi:insulysin
MELGLTLEGFSNRSAVAAAFFESIRTSIRSDLQLELIKQYLSTAILHGYLFVPRPPDAISLAVDAQRFGVGGTGIGVEGYWHLIPSPQDDEGSERMRQIVHNTLVAMSNEQNAIVSFRASPKAIFEFSQGIVDQKITTPPLFSPWQVEPITGARYLVESRLNGGDSYFKSLAWFAANFDGDKLTPPFLNPLIPTKLRPPRPILTQQAPWGRRLFYLEDANAFDVSNNNKRNGWKLTKAGVWREYQSSMSNIKDSNWMLRPIPPGYSDLIGLPLPARPPEPSIEGVFVIQLLSSLPSSFTSRQLMLSNLWLLSFDEEILDLSELGASAGTAYETSFNSNGLRLSFRGVSQTLPSYVRRFCRRLVQHHTRILDGSTKVSESVYRKDALEAGRSSKISMLNNGHSMSSFSSQFSEQDIANQGSFFLKCTSGGVVITQGDILPKEGNTMLEDVRYIFRDYTASNHFETNPDIRDLLYRPYWRPRDSSPCLLPGVALISESCGRVPR